VTAEIEFFLQGKCNSWLLQPPSQRTSEKLSADQFAKYFRDKIDDIQSSTASADPLVLVTRQVSPLSSFRPATVSEAVKLLKDMPAKSCELDPVPTWLLKQIAPYIAPTICQLCNLSMECSVFPAQLKQARVLLLLKKSSLDPDVATSYRPISNLSYLSKLIERVVVTRFAEHSSTNKLLPVQQSAYRPYHSTETAIVSVYNDLVRTVDNGNVSLLILLDLSAAFDTGGHSILLSVLANRFSMTLRLSAGSSPICPIAPKPLSTKAFSCPTFQSNAAFPRFGSGPKLLHITYRGCSRSAGESWSTVATLRRRHSVPR